jgi:hypothetical protein
LANAICFLVSDTNPALTNRFSAEFGQRAHDECIDADHILFDAAARSLFFQLREVGPFENHVSARLGQRFAQHVGNLLANRVAGVIAQQRLAVSCLVGNAADRYLALERGTCWCSGCNFQLRLLLQGVRLRGFLKLGLGRLNGTAGQQCKRRQTCARGVTTINLVHIFLVI